MVLPLHVPKWKTSTDKDIRDQFPGEITNETTIEIRDTNNRLLNQHAYRDIKLTKNEIQS